MELQMKMNQQMKLSQQMIQSSQILQMGALELSAYIKEMALENPVMDLEEKFSENKDKANLEEKLKWLQQSDEQNRVYYRQEYGDGGEKDIWNFVEEHTREDLWEYLQPQLLTRSLSSKEMETVEYMVHCLDDKGYLDEDIEVIANCLHITAEEANQALTLLQGLEPAGIGARNIKECLLLQVEREAPQDWIVKAVISNCLELLSKNQLPRIAKKLGTTLEEVAMAQEIIRSLNPKPGGRFGGEAKMSYIVPDMIVVKLKDYYEILLNENMYPDITINAYYHSLFLKETEKETKDYLNNKIKQAEWIRDCIAQRNKTLLDVVRKIVDMQQDFFACGQGLKPIRLADVADALNIHESTVSRAIKEKYLQCTWGIYPLHFFFRKGLLRESGQEKISVLEIKRRIKEIVDEEDKKKPLSDQKVMERLMADGISISRRTVAKYRDSMGIGYAGSRKQFM